MTNRTQNSFFLTPTTRDEVEKILLLLNTSNPGWDGVSSVVIKRTYAAFIEPLVTIINKSFQTGLVPNELKLAIVIPIFKNADPMLFSNYRSVSVLPFFSKIFERLFYNHMISFINENNILYSNQFGFRRQHATYKAIITLLDKISQAIEKGEYVIGIFIDLSKAFDTVQHDFF
jgi:hypothetical protein